jgi:hypothetical protein
MNTDKFRLIVVVALLLLLTLLAMDKAEGSPEIVAKITRAATKYNVDPKLAVAIATVESNLDPSAIGASGEVGLYQLHPRYHDVSSNSVDSHIDRAVRYLSDVINRCAHRFGSAAHVCFNYGPNTKIERPTETAYFKKVDALYRGAEPATKPFKVERLPYNGQ